MCALPLCTATVRPTKSGVMVERRDQVLIGFLSLIARAFSTFAIRWPSTNGPFLIERAIASIPQLTFCRVTAAHDHRVGPLVLARLVALGRRAPRRHRVMSSATAVGAPAHRVVDRVHRDTAHRRADAAPAVRTRLADRAQ